MCLDLNHLVCVGEGELGHHIFDCYLQSRLYNFASIFTNKIKNLDQKIKLVIMVDNWPLSNYGESQSCFNWCQIIYNNY